MIVLRLAAVRLPTFSSGQKAVPQETMAECRERGQGQPTPEDVLRQLVEEQGDTSFVFRRGTLERAGEWVASTAGGGDHDEGAIRDVKSKRRCGAPTRRSRPAGARPRSAAGRTHDRGHARACRTRGLPACGCSVAPPPPRIMARPRAASARPGAANRPQAAWALGARKGMSGLLLDRPRSAPVAAPETPRGCPQLHPQL
jgi:hypothetical protein